jgi:GNAT superfamily N-acetyltransferase
MGNLSFKTFIGSEIEREIEPLANLRISVFRDYPYLYDGTIAHEKEYLNRYIKSSAAFLFAVFDAEKMVGATTCIALKDETPDIQEPFMEAGISLDEVCYFGESILLKEYRGKGLGVRFFEEREKHAANLKASIKAFCAVKRAINHPLKPKDYQDLSSFWLKRGYQKSPTLKSTFSWKDINEKEETLKTMEYWTKNL